MGNSHREATNLAGGFSDGAKIPSRAPPGSEARTKRPGARRLSGTRIKNLKSTAAPIDGDALVSARKLAARLWKRLQQLPETTVATAAGGMKGAPESRRNELAVQDEPSTGLESKIEGATKRSSLCGKNEQTCGLSAVLALKHELEQAQARIRELEETRSCHLNKRLEHVPRKTIADIKAKLAFERRARKRMERANSRLVDELIGAKSSAKWLMRCCETERKNREHIEDLCKEQAMKIKEAEALSWKLMKLRMEAEEEREMLQVAEALREQQVYMKLLDARLVLDEKYSDLSLLVTNLERFLRLKGIGDGTRRETEDSQEAVDLVNVKDVKEFSYELHRPNSFFQEPDEDTGYMKNNTTEIEPVLISSPASVLRDLNAIITRECSREDHKDIF